MGGMNATNQEIASQPPLWEKALRLADEVSPALAAPGERVLAIGCGTSAFVAQAYASLRESAGLGETDAAYASEMPINRKYDRVVAITRSGTTTEILDALGKIPAGTRKVAVTAVKGEAVDDMTDEQILLDFADETSVVQTRFPTTLLALIRASVGHDTSRLVSDGEAAISEPLPVDVTAFDHFVFLGTSWTIGLAHEAALKIREAAQAWSESYPAMDYRHGPIAVATKRSLVTAFGPLPSGLDTAISEAGATLHHRDRDPLAELVFGHRLAVALAEHRGLNPDTPRLLTRSVVLS